MSSSKDASVKVQPAHPSFLTIYNPSLGTTDESERDQIVFYWSRYSRSRKSRCGDGSLDSGAAEEDEHEKLRQVGLAQAMVVFAK